MKEENLIKAKEYAKSKDTEYIKYDIVRFAGEKDGLEYYRYTSSSFIGKKTGMPQFIKIDSTGKISNVETYSEEMWWAMDKEAVLNDF